MMTPTLATISLLVWLGCLVVLSPSLVRVYRNVARPADEERSALLFAAGLIVSFNLRRLLMEANTTALNGLYLISILLGAYILILAWRKRRG